jgi:hypothetical protein
MAERMNEALGRLKEVEALHRRIPLVPPLKLDQAELAELRQLCADLPRLWRHPTVAPEQRKSLVRQILKAVILTPAADIIRLEIEWVGGARTTVAIPRQPHVVEVIRDAYGAGLVDGDIVKRLHEQGFVHLHGKLVGRRYDTKAVAALIRRKALQRPFDNQAYAIIREQWSAVSAETIANELNEKKIRHRLGKWTRSRVLTAMKQLRHGRIAAVDPIPTVPRLAPQVLALHDAGFPPPEIVRRLRDEGAVTMRGTPVTINVVYAIYRHLKLRAHSGHVNKRVGALLEEWAGKAAPSQIAQRLNDLGLRHMRGGLWNERNVMWKIKSLGLDGFDGRREASA